MTADGLIDADELAEALRDPDWVVVDCRFKLPEPQAGFLHYLDGHIPGARYAHLDRDLARRPGPTEGRHPLPHPERFADCLGAWGLTPTHHVAVYDDAGGAIAARLWWMLRWLGHERAWLLDGGIGAWRESPDRPLERRLPTWRARAYRLSSVRDDWVLSSDEVARLEGTGSCLVDARAPERYRGEHEPIDPVAGHVPGARNLPFTELLDRRGRFKGRAELEAVLAERIGACRDEQVVAMCGSGVTACHLLAAQRLAGRGAGRLYVGSWSEWIRDPARPVVATANASS